MADHIDEWSEINKFVQKLSEENRLKLFQELKRSGSVENPIQYTETHLEGGIEEHRDKGENLLSKSLDGRWT
ncbi:hypothetical protein SAMN04515679_0589 [Pelosinus fermentans]|uniref:hypothetical protein n=1 Tax=Pelosinus fermentans TaxID=365349 RepID=UPI0002684637|nr:hypothetical protein [Pelosinus fermentans]OAM92519.1 hypothetical protein FR7_00535 [Pelosinus fermentans DSM 17108]SDQ47560.1 hypothetical protein SAMN04515679_0589 [Pelosinus fermentans]